MKNKCILAFLLTIVMLFTSVSFVSAENAVEATADITEETVVEKIDTNEFKAMYAMGFLGEELTLLDKDAYISRAHFAGYLFKLAGYSVTEYTTETIPFVDVSIKTPYYREICTMHEMGIVSGTGDGMFRPGAHITYAQVAKLIVDVLGYRSYAEIRYGDYPEAYVSMAEDLELNKGITDVKWNSEMTVKNTVKMLFNAGLTEVMTFNGVDKDGNITAKTDGKTLFEKKHDIYFREGTMQCNGISSIESADIADGVYVIDRVSYDCHNVNLADLLGYKIKFFYKETDGRGKLLWAYQDERFGKVLEFKAEELAINDSNYSISNIVYYTEDGKTKDAKLKPLVDVIYNNSYYEIPTDDIIKPKMGKMRLIDNNDDGYYDIVIIEEFYNLVVKTVAPTGQHVVDKYNRTVNFGDYDYTMIIKDGKEITFDELTSGIVISCIENREKNRLYMYVTSERYEGTLKSTSTSRGRTIYNFDNGTYRMSSDFERVMADNNIITVKPQIGRKYVYYLDMGGEIAEVIDTNTAMQYALLMSARAGEVYEDGIVYTRLLLTDGNKVSGITKKKLIIDGVRKNASELMSESSLYDEGGAVKPQVVMVAFDEEGYLKEIDFAQDNTATDMYFDTDNFSLDSSKTSRVIDLSNLKVFGYMYVVNENSFVFTEWTGLEISEPYTVGNKSFLYSGESEKVDIYDANEKLEVAIAFKQTSGAEMWQDGRMIVDEIDYIYDDGYEVKRITGYIKNQKRTFVELYPGTIPATTKRGDIVRVGLYDGKVANIATDFTAEDYATTQTRLSQGIEPYAINVIMYTPVYTVTPSSITFVPPESWRTKYGPFITVPLPTSVNAIQIYDLEQDIVYEGDIRDIYQAYSPQKNGLLPDKDDLIMAYVGLKYGQLVEIMLVVR